MISAFVRPIFAARIGDDKQPADWLYLTAPIDDVNTARICRQGTDECLFDRPQRLRNRADKNLSQQPIKSKIGQIADQTKMVTIH